MGRFGNWRKRGESYDQRRREATNLITDYTLNIARKLNVEIGVIHDKKNDKPDLDKLIIHFSATLEETAEQEEAKKEKKRL